MLMQTHGAQTGTYGRQNLIGRDSRVIAENLRVLHTQRILLSH